MPDSFSSFDLDWALPLVPLTLGPEIVFLRVCAFIGLSRSRETTGDSALWRWIVVFGHSLSIFLTLCFHKVTSQRDGERAIGRMSDFRVAFYIRAERLFQNRLLIPQLTGPYSMSSASLINSYFSA